MGTKGQLDIAIQQKAFIYAGAIIIGLISVALVFFNLNPVLANTPQARASLTAHTLAFYLASLSSVDEGTMEKNFNETYVVQIDKYSGLSIFFRATPVSNYYLKVFLYDEKGKQIAESEEVSFIADISCSLKPGGGGGGGGGGASASFSGLAVGEASTGTASFSDENTCITTEKISFITFRREAGRPITIAGFQTAKESGFTFCKKTTTEEIESYVNKYSDLYKVEKPLILAVMGSESCIQHCENSVVKRSEAGAIGLMQVMPSTARGLETEYKNRFKTEISFDLDDPELNVHAGVFLLSTHLKYYEGYDNQKELTVANYNCGGIDDAVKKYCAGSKTGCWAKIKPHLGRGKEYCTNSDETIPYVDEVMKSYKCFDNCLKANGACYAAEPCKKELNC